MKINNYEELKKSVKNKEIIHSSVYKKFGVGLYDVYIEIFGIPQCEHCEIELNEKHFKGLKSGFKNTCSMKCTNLHKYGVECVLHLPENQEKSKKTLFEKYGVHNPSQIEEVKQRKKDNLMQKYGVDNPSKIEFVKEKKKRTNLEKYGFEFFSQSQEYLIKIKETSLKKYGVEHFTQSKEYKETLSKKIHFSQLNITNYENYNQSFIENNFIENGKFKMLDAMKYYNVGSTILHRRFDIPKRISLAESELSNIIPNSILNDRAFIKPLEIDILSHEYKFGVEYNGLMWHSSGIHEKFPKEFNEDYHLIKTNLVQEKGYQLFHIFEDEWLDPIKKQIWLSILKNKMNDFELINLDKYIIADTSKETIKEFMIFNSLDNYINSEINLGLYLNNELLSIISFNKIVNREYRITNSCTKINININNFFYIILEYFKNKYNPKILYYRANRRWNTEYLDFSIQSIEEPEYFYFKCDKNIFLSNSNESKSILLNLDNYNSELSEIENMYNNGYRKIYDAGYVNFKLNIN